MSAPKDTLSLLTPVQCQMRDQEDGPFVPAHEAYALSDEILRLRAALKVGDAVAHQLLYRDHGGLLDAWWAARGGHEACTVCHETGTADQRSASLDIKTSGAAVVPPPPKIEEL